ncbi:glycosyltransferase [Paeniglutamicibacter sulfureus]|uniref:glycosyltransferase n=1 Tax=Paeniglutamicibacter sulfureus TaxID=43666 RepID=UPI002665F8A2|nr:glycosyltransferase [Paeniglutamicibacter sulfureus]MDO2935991.1 glycosyltransferase [Paeniglutamicibacter sulfureus]
MDEKSLKKRQSAIKRRVAQLTDPEGFPMGFDMRKHLKSRYHREALAGAHPFYEPAKDFSEYDARRKYFNEQRQGAVDEYSEIVNRAETNGQRWYTPFDLKIGIIADEFLYKSFVSTALFIPLTPTNFRDFAGELDLVLVTTSWRGLAQEWVGAAQHNSNTRTLIEEELIPYYQDLGTPVAFYSKEDPPNYEAFLSTAQRCDFVFTSAVEMIEKYKVACPKAKAFDVLPFSVDFRHHNPVGSRRNRISDVLFAGSWHNHKYSERRAAAYRIFDGVIASGRRLRIIDRNWDLDNERYMFPERYLPYVEPTVPHDELLRIHRTSDIVINLNSVVSSSTMYANRVVELQAMGCTVLSNYNAGVNDQFPNVYMPESSFDTQDIIASLDDDHLYENQMGGLRTAYAEHANFDRMRCMLSACGLASKEKQTRRIGVVGEPAAVAIFIDTQNYAGKLEPFTDAISAEAAGVDLVCDIEASYSYGQYYLQDLVNATKYVDSRSIFKADDTFERTSQHNYTDRQAPAHGSLTWVSEGHTETATSDRNYVVDNLQVRAAARDREEIAAVPKAKLSVVVPVYNNGRHLRYKCFESLRRSSIFDQMEILLIDDGSTDPETVATVKELASNYTNVRAYLHETGGSGSASRPRNVGLEMAAGEWITYLDPDNEALSDGYAKLLQLAERSDSQFAIGNMLRNAQGRTLTNNVRTLRRQIYETEVGPDTYGVDAQVLSKINYTPMSIQALVANTAWLRSLGIEQPVGAVGQDSYFFQQMLYYATQISLLGEPIHTYFAAVSNSTVNTLGTTFFRKYIPLERSRAQWLGQIGLLEDYKQRRFEGFIKGWYLEKLNRVSKEERQQSSEVIVELAGYYGEHEWKDEGLRGFFTKMSL